MPKLHGANLSPFVRKVRVALAEKGIEYEHEQVLPFGQTPEYMALSPLGKVPCYQDGDVTIPDSSVIIDYIDHVEPNPPLYPSDPGQRARALWYEEYCDTKLVNALSTVFFQRFVGPKFMGQETDQAAVDAALNDEIPPIFDYLEGELGDDGFLVGDHFSIADIAATSPFVNFAIVGESVDAGRWPKLAAYVERIHARPHYKAIVEGDLAVGQG
jgi:glutathione S-transferase